MMLHKLGNIILGKLYNQQKGEKLGEAKTSSKAYSGKTVSPAPGIL
jgi:hypothetical protein